MFGEDDSGRVYHTNIECYGNIIINAYKTLFGKDTLVEIIK